ncbi:MAG: esterase-like activity of phytase family protein [Pseudomonadota bacterium]
MTWIARTPLAVLGTLAGLALAAPLAAEEEIYPITEPIALEAGADTAKVDRLIYRGGLVLDPGEAKIGGISGLEWNASDLYAITDDGRWLIITPDESNAQLLDLTGITIGTLRDEKGKKLKKKLAADAEAITKGAGGDWLVSFEQDHRVWRYETLGFEAAPFPTDADDLVADAEPNGGLETFATLPSGALLACGEWAQETARPNCVRINDAGAERFALPAPPALAEHGGAPTDAACASDGACYVLFRSYKPGYGNRAAIVKLTDEGSETLAVLDTPLSLDNFEGLAVREQYGKTFLYLASDDNFRNCAYLSAASCQRTLLMKFEIDTPEAALPPPPDAPEPPANYDTVNVVLETGMGDITIALETERAPITAANFLRYVEEGRFDGTKFYRAMRLEREPKPNGLLQGGTQFDPKRILPPIAHEPTSQTGLSHTNGALSMAMGDPGTANGDFSIMLQDQTGLDARPDAQEAVWRNGYAVFGYVIDGMDVVAAIHGSPIDPDKGEGFLKGQMLAEPVTIVKARRAAEDESEVGAGEDDAGKVTASK